MISTDTQDWADNQLEMPRLLITADEAFPALEQLVLDAKERVTASFRVFDPTTTLRSDAARAVGETWADLITHILRNGVRVSIVISDFDPVARFEMHTSTHRAIRGLRAAAIAAGREDLLEVQAAMHPARTGKALQVGLMPFVQSQLRGIVTSLNEMDAESRRETLDLAPHLSPLIEVAEDGTVSQNMLTVHPIAPVTHHQKMLVVDGKWLYIGGLDLDDRRYDDQDHEQAPTETWHDVQMIVDGPIVAEAERHINSFLAETAGEADPKPTQHLLRTLSVRRPDIAQNIGPRPVLTEIEARHHAAIANAQSLIYLESQFFRDRRLADALCERAEAEPDLSLLCLLPSAPEEAVKSRSIGLDIRFGEKLQAECIEQVKFAFGERALFCSPAAPFEPTSENPRANVAGGGVIYIHAKVSVFDDRCAIVSSANLNGRSMRWDTETGVAITTPDTVQHMRRRLMAHWLPADAETAFFEPRTAVTTWRELALTNAAKDPSERRGFILPMPVSEAREAGQSIPFLPEEMA